VSAQRPAPLLRADFPYSQSITTRWTDNDAYGHVNNIVYYSYFDTAVNTWLIAGGHLDIQGSPQIGVVAETSCHYFSPLTYPETVTAGLRVVHLGRSSVRYQIAIFAEGSDVAAAQGEFVHVYVDRVTRRPTAIPDGLRRALEGLQPA
jgi:acyl-CoA thioester hydrolase